MLLGGVMRRLLRDLGLSWVVPTSCAAMLCGAALAAADDGQALQGLTARPDGPSVQGIRSDGGILFPTLQDLVRRSDAVVVGRILKGRQKLTKDRKAVTTFYLVHVQEVLKGELRNGDRVVIAVPGGAGRVAGKTVRFRRIDARRIQTDQSHVLFLHRPTTKAPGYDLTGGTQGLWRLQRGRTVPINLAPQNPLAKKYSGQSMTNLLDDLRALQQERPGGRKGGLQ